MKISALKKLEFSIREMVCVSCLIPAEHYSIKDDRDLSPRGSRNGCPKNRQKKYKTIGAKTNLILYNCFVQIGV